MFIHHLRPVFGGSNVLMEILGGLGRTGVVLFFVHTSLVLMESLERLSAGNRHFIWGFYIRRIFRIYPLAICAIIGAMMLRVPATWEEATKYSAPGIAQILSNLLLVQNITRQQSILGPLWSLPLEVQMYVVLPFLFIFFSSTARWISYMVTAWGLALLSALGVFYLTGHMNLFAYIPCFLSGVVAYRCRFAQRRWPFFLWPCLIVCLSVLGAAFYSDQVAAEIHNLAWEWPVALILGLSWHRFHEVRSAAVTKAAHWVAKYSYGIYLWHHIVIFLVFYRLPVMSGVVRALVAIAGTAAASVASFHCVEDPLIRVGKRVAAFSVRRSNAPPSEA